MHHNKLASLPDKIFEDQEKLRLVKLLDNKFSPALTKKHPAFEKLLASKVLRQLDIKFDSGDGLEDMWERKRMYPQMISPRDRYRSPTKRCRSTWTCVHKC